MAIILDLFTKACGLPFNWMLHRVHGTKIQRQLVDDLKNATENISQFINAENIYPFFSEAIPSVQSHYDFYTAKSTSGETSKIKNDNFDKIKICYVKLALLEEKLEYYNKKLYSYYDWCESKHLTKKSAKAVSADNFQALQLELKPRQSHLIDRTNDIKYEVAELRELFDNCVKYIA